jgi:23S rRNA pseudouridine1911/1915/1917 synthase
MPTMPPDDFLATRGRLDAVVGRRLEVSRAEAQRAIADGRVRVDGVTRSKSFRLFGGERIVVDPAPSAGLSPEEPAVPVRFEDDWLAIVSKPPGLVTHPTASRRSGTLVNRLLGMGMPLAPGAEPLRPGIVHRLDAGTSGLLVVTKDDVTREAMVALFRRHDVERVYLALVRGDAEPDRFEVDAPLARSGARVRVHTGTGRRAATRFEVRQRFERSTLIEARPRTGRTHQIRVHLSAIGHPILGDTRYGGGGDDAGRLGLSRPFLHSWKLSFVHPRTGLPVAAEDPLPPDLDSALLRARAAT